MALFDDPLDTRVQLVIDSKWQDITPYVYQRDPISITYGKANEGNTPDPATLTMTVNNRDGRFSPRNAAGAWYGKIGRGTPVRVQVKGTHTGMLCTGVTGSSASTPSVAALNPTDLQLYAEFALDSFAHTAVIMAKGTRGSTLGYALLVGFTNGLPHITLRWSVAGTDVQAIDAACPGLAIGGRLAIIAILDTNNGAGGHSYTFYSAPTTAGPYTIFATGTLPGTTSIHSNTEPLIIGESTGDTDYFTGTIYSATTLATLGGAAASSPQFAAQSAGTTSFVDSLSRTWTLGAHASIAALYQSRATCEISSLPQSWDITGKDVYVPITAAGVLRRLSQGQPAAVTGLEQEVLSLKPTRYFPCTVGHLGGYKKPNYLTPTDQLYKNGAINVQYGAGDLGPTIAKGMLLITTLSGSTIGQLNALPQIGLNATAVATEFMWRSDDLGLFEIDLQDYGVSGTNHFVTIYRVILRNDGTNQDIRVFRDVFAGLDSPPVETLLGSATGVGALGDVDPHYLRVLAIENAGDTDVLIYIDGQLVLTVVNSSALVNGLGAVGFGYQPGASATGVAPVAIGGFTVWSSTDPIPPVALMSQAAFGFTGETAGDRIERLTQQNLIPFRAQTDPVNTITLGAQSSTASLLSALNEAAGTDAGYLTESRDQIGTTYLGRASLYNQTADLTIDYTAHILGAVPDVIEDDQNLGNDVTASSPTGGSAEAILTTGRLSVNPPPNGVNTIKASVSVNPASDALLPDQASWQLGLRTVDEARIPNLTFNMATPAIANNPTLIQQIMDLDVGSQVELINMPAFLGADDPELIILGYTEDLGPYGLWTIVANTTPAAPYQVAVYGASQGDPNGSRFDAENSTVGTGFTTTATSASIASATQTQPWTTDAAAFPFDIGINGEQITVTNITSSTSPQTFTVTRSVNGVVLAHSAGEQVSLWDTPRFAL